MKFVVAIDGPAAAGKGTIAKAVAKHFNLPHLDTGLLYRGIGKKALAYSRTSYYPEVAKQLALDLKPSDLNPNELRTPEIAEAASKVAKITEVREVLLDFQRSFANQDGGAVLDGRDIGTVICPDADIKLFVTASAEVRSYRRYKELKNNNNINLTISSAKPPIFWKDKEIVKQQLYKWDLYKIQKLIYNLNEIELLVKKNFNNSINFITDFILQETSSTNN